MKKIFLTILSLAGVTYSAQCFAGWTFAPRRFANDVSAKAHTLVERDNDNYWLNNIRFYRTYPINFYGNKTPQNVSDSSSLQTVTTREYPYDMAVAANYGQRMYDSETYSVQQKSTEGVYAPQSDGVIFTTNKEIHLTQDMSLEPIGEVKISGEYYLIFEPEHNGQLILIDKTGQIMPMIGYLYNNEFLASKDKAQVSPRDLAVAPQKDKQFTTDPQMQFEIIYDGARNNVMSFQYIDHRTPAVGSTYTQRFSFPTGQDVININGVRFKILHADENHVEYMLLK